MLLGAGLGAESVNQRRDRIRALEAESAALLRDGRIQATIPLLSRLVELEPYNENALYRLALALLYQESPPSAAAYRESLQQARRLLERCAVLQSEVSERGSALALRHFHLGMLLWMQGDRNGALAAFERSYLADYQRLDALYNQYAIQEELGQLAAAAATRKRYLRLVARGDLDD
ncbi:MAG: hypothetical protein K1X75_04505 [Leptospirales bacterium]|nr:hypothetical protein [Leptospirales bacterium]